MASRRFRLIGDSFVLKGMLGAALLLAGSTSVMAQEYGDVPLAGQISHIDLSANDAQALAFPPEMTIKQLFRYYDKNNGSYRTRGELPLNGGYYPGEVKQGSLGIGSHTPYPGSHAVYACFMQSITTTRFGKQFSSLDPNCEGWYKDEKGYLIAYVNDVQVPGTAPVYRCYNQRKLEHYDTFSSDCEGVAGAVNEGVLGYFYL